MYSLILKDLLIQKRTFISILFVTVITSLNFTFSPEIMFSFIATFSAYSLLTGTFYYDERANVMLNSFPLTRKTIIVSKYISPFIFHAIGIIVAYAIPNIFYIANIIQVPSTLHPEIIIGSFAGTIILASVDLPVYYKYGYTATRYVFLFLFLGVFLVFTLLFKSKDINFSIVSNSLQNIPDSLICLMLVVFLCAIYAVSFLMSYFSYKNKDF